MIGSWGAARVAAGVVSRHGVVAAHGDCSFPFGWASVTKLCTTLATLVAVEEGSLSLDDPAGPPGSTVRHLLAHASGLGPSDAQTPLAPPGSRRIYSNAGFEVLAAHLVQATGMTFGSYLEAGVFGPLQMGGSHLEGSAAAGGSGPLEDVLRLAGELLEPTVISRATLDAATAVAFAGLDGVLPGFGRQSPCDWGLGFELKNHKAPHWTGTHNSPTTFGHFGQTGTMLWVDPVAGLACVALADRPFASWAARAWPALSDAVLTEVARTS